MKYDILTAAIVRETQSYKHFYGQYAVKVENLPNNRQQGYGSGCFGRIRIRIFLRVGFGSSRNIQIKNLL